MMKFCFLASILIGLSGCFGVSTTHPLCKDHLLTDVTGLEGPIKSAEPIGDIHADVERLQRGIYLIKEQNPPRNRPENMPYPAIRFCRIDQKIFSEYQMYEPESKKLSPRTFWPNEVKVKGNQLHFYLADTDIAKLELQNIPYFRLKNKDLSQPAFGFVVNNQDASVDKKLIHIFHTIDSSPNTVIDLKNRFVLSPIILY